MRNTGTVESGDLLLIDAGVEVNSLYTADITRTFPTNGKFTDFQKKLYQAVWTPSRPVSRLPSRVPRIPTFIMRACV